MRTAPTQGLTGGLLSNLGGFVIDTYPMYLTCILHVFRMYLDVTVHIHQDIHQDTSRYIKIHQVQDTFVSVTLTHDASKIHCIVIFYLGVS